MNLMNKLQDILVVINIYVYINIIGIPILLLLLQILFSRQLTTTTTTAAAARYYALRSSMNVRVSITAAKSEK